MTEQPTEGTIRVVVADDHPLYREGLVTAITTMPGKEVVGEAADGQQAVAAVDELRPDVVVMDLHMPLMNGVDATRAITARAASNPVWRRSAPGGARRNVVAANAAPG